MKIAFIIISITFITSSYILDTSLKATNNAIQSQSQPGEFNLEDTTYFTIVRDYINQNGEVLEVNASSSMDRKMMVTYHSIIVDSMEISTDHSDRIYMNLAKKHYGNILKEDGKIRPEIIYGVPDTNPALTKQKEKKVLEIYRSLIVRALSK